MIFLSLVAEEVHVKAELEPICWHRTSEFTDTGKKASQSKLS